MLYIIYHIICPDSWSLSVVVIMNLKCSLLWKPEQQHWSTYSGKEKKTSDVFVILFRYILWSGFCKEMCLVSLVQYAYHSHYPKTHTLQHNIFSCVYTFCLITLVGFLWICSYPSYCPKLYHNLLSQPYTYSLQTIYVTCISINLYM